MYFLRNDGLMLKSAMSMASPMGQGALSAIRNVTCGGTLASVWYRAGT